MVVCAAFDLIVSGAKTEFMCLRAKGMPESTATVSVEAAGQVYNQTNEFVYLGGNVNHDADMSIEVDRRIRNAWCSFRKYTLELYDRPSAPLELKIRMLRAEVPETMLYGCITWSPRTCHYDTLRRAHHRFLTRRIGWRKHNHVDHPNLYLDALIKTGSESVEATLRSRRIFFAGFVARMEDTRLPKCVMFGEMVGGAGCVRGQEKEWMGCFLDDLRAFGINADQWTTAAQDEGEWRRTRGGTFHSKLDRCRESQGWTTACSGMPDRDGKDQGEDVLVRLPLLTSHKWRELVSSGRLVCGCHDVFLWCSVCFVLFCFRSYAFVEAAALRSSVLRYAGAPIATRVSFFFSFLLFIWRCRLFRVFFVPFPLSLCMESTSYVLSF